MYITMLKPINREDNVVEDKIIPQLGSGLKCVIIIIMDLDFVVGSSSCIVYTNAQFKILSHDSDGAPSDSR